MADHPVIQLRVAAVCPQRKRAKLTHELALRHGGGLDRRRKGGMAHEIPVHTSGGRAALGDCPDDQRLPAAHVARDEHAWHGRSEICVARNVAALVNFRAKVGQQTFAFGADGKLWVVAVDTVDAGVGETVLIVSGSSARMASGMKDCPVDAAIVGIIDSIEVSG